MSRKKKKKLVIKKKLQQSLHNIQMLGMADVKSQGDVVTIAGHANKFIVDRGNDRISTDAWELGNYKNNPVILFNHGMDPQLGSTPIGRATEIEPTKDGLRVKAVLSQLDDPLINRIRGLVKERILRAFSVGFDPKDSKVDPTTGIKDITKAELFEISIVGVPMNQDSLFELSSKQILSHSTMELKKSMLDQKGAWLAGAVHNRIYQLQESGKDRAAILESIAESAGISTDDLMDVLAGNVTPTPEGVITALSSILELDADELKRLDSGDEKLTEKAEDTEAEDTEAEDTEPDVEKTSQDTDEAIEEEEDEDEQMKAFRVAVSERIPVLMAKGMSPDQAITLAIDECSAGKSIKPPREFYEDWFKVAARGFVKQADQGEEVVDNPTQVASANTSIENDNFGSPFLEASKQTNVLLGALINEIQMMSSKLDQIAVQEIEEDEPPEEISDNTSNTPEPEKEEVAAEEDEDEENSQKSIDAARLDRYAKRMKAIKMRLEQITN
jgi:HK97 family phage prohead protease